MISAFTVCPSSSSRCATLLPPQAWESSARVTKEDWAEWMRHFSVELLAQSPSPALRACHALAQVRIPAAARGAGAGARVAAAAATSCAGR